MAILWDSMAQAELLAKLTDAREDYRAMAAQGHQGLAGWCIARACKIDAQLDKFFRPAGAQGQEQEAGKTGKQATGAGSGQEVQP